jgi:queuosine precursor transporter
MNSNHAVIVGYLVAIIAANLFVATFGPASSIFSAFLLIGLNLTARDYLHSAWGGRPYLWPKMAALIACGSLLSWAINADAGVIALASFLAFAASESVDALVYNRLRHSRWAVKVNGSNVFSAAVDSVLFPLVAFGGFLPLITAGQFLAKVFGGAMWSWVLKPGRFLPLLVLLLPANVSAQSVSVGVGDLRTAYESIPVVELSAVHRGFVAVLSRDARSWGKPTVLVNRGIDFTAFPVIVGADAGFLAGPWNDYAVSPTVGLRALSFFGGHYKVVALVSWEPKQSWNRTALIKIDRRLF